MGANGERSEGCAGLRGERSVRREVVVRVRGVGLLVINKHALFAKHRLLYQHILLYKHVLLCRPEILNNVVFGHMLVHNVVLRSSGGDISGSKPYPKTHKLGKYHSACK